MPRSANVSNPEEKGSPISQTPNWDVVPFDVNCARCGFDLRGLSDPRCPECSLEFDWSEAVPIEQLTCLKCGYNLYGLDELRCPECGQPFDWEEVLADYRRRRKPVFEYHWRTRPIRSLKKSVLLAMRPWKLWREIEIHDPPVWGGLTLLLVVIATVSIGTVPFFSFSSRWLLYGIDRLFNLPPEAMPGWAGFAMHGYDRRLPFVAWWRWGIGLEHVARWGFVIFCWALAGYLALLVLRQSMARCKVRNGHVFRACVYGLVPMPVFLLLNCIFVTFIDACILLIQPELFGLGVVVLLIAWVVFFGSAIGAWALFFVSITLAYHRYIKMPHAWAVVISSQVIAFLVLVIVQSWMRLL